MTVEPRCPACCAGFVLTGRTEPGDFPTHYLAVQTNEGQRGTPVYRQGTEACPMSGQPITPLHLGG